MRSIIFGLCSPSEVPVLSTPPAALISMAVTAASATLSPE